MSDQNSCTLSFHLREKRIRIGYVQLILGSYVTFENIQNAGSLKIQLAQDDTEKILKQYPLSERGAGYLFYFSEGAKA